MCCAPGSTRRAGSRWMTPGHGIKAPTGCARRSATTTSPGSARRSSKSRLNFLDLLRAGHTDYVINDAALSYMRDRALSGPVIARLAEHPDKQFADHGAWQAHLERLGHQRAQGHPRPGCRSPPRARCGAASSRMTFCARRWLSATTPASSIVGRHALCWVHAERLVHKLDTFTDLQRAAQQHIRSSDLAVLRRPQSLSRRADRPAM